MKYLLSIVLSIVFYQTGIAQEESSYETLSAASHATLMKSTAVVPPSPQAASFGRYGEYPVSLYTGAVDISIPVTGIAGRRLSFPVTLNYTSGGIRVNALPSWVGSGWDLSLGGVITHSPEGRPDVKANYYDRAADIHSLNTAVTDYYKQRQKLFLEAADPRQNFKFDTQPDHYTLTFPGGGAKFYLPPQNIDSVRSGTKAAEVIFKKVVDYRVEPYFDATGKIDSFLVTDTRGNLYHYTLWEETTTTFDQSHTTFPTPPMTHRSAWYLTSIESFDRTESILLDYDTESGTFSMPVNEDDGDMVSVPTRETVYADPPSMCGFDQGGGGSISYCSQGISFISGGISTIGIDYRRQLRQVTYFSAGERHTRLDFHRSPYTGADNFGISKLDKVSVHRGPQANLTSNVVFSYYSGTPRLNLRSVEEKSSGGGLTKGITSFTYNSVQLPRINSNAVDFWGFYNGQTSNVGLIPAYTDCNGGGYSFGQGGALRHANDDAVAGSLKRIIHPTGGYTEFTFEPHTVAKFGGCPTTNTEYQTRAGGIRIQRIDSYEGDGKLAFSKNYTYTLEGSTASSGQLLTHFSVSSYDSYSKYSDQYFDPCHPGNAEYTCHSLKVYANPRSTVASSEGEHVGYSRVTETFAGSTASVKSLVQKSHLVERSFS